jgi:hypothetical protein
MRITLTGNFFQEKARVTGEMRLCLSAESALRTDQRFPPILKEVAIKIGVVSVLQYSARFVPWSKTELDQISTISCSKQIYQTKQKWKDFFVSGGVCTSLRAPTSSFSGCRHSRGRSSSCPRYTKIVFTSASSAAFSGAGAVECDDLRHRLQFET